MGPDESQYRECASRHVPLSSQDDASVARSTPEVSSDITRSRLRAVAIGSDSTYFAPVSDIF